MNPFLYEKISRHIERWEEDFCLRSLQAIYEDFGQESYHQYLSSMWFGDHCHWPAAYQRLLKRELDIRL